MDKRKRQADKFQYKEPTWLLKPRRGGKTLWDWFELLIVPALIAIIAGTFAGTFTLFSVSQLNKISRHQNEIFKQRDKAEDERNQQALLIEYLDEISELVEQQLLTLNDNNNSQALRTIAKARTLTILKSLDSDRKGELIQFLSAAELINADNPLINLFSADLAIANLKTTILRKADLNGTLLYRANFWGANLMEAD